MKKLIFGLIMAVAVLGCDDSEELTCEVLQDPNFCWAIAVNEAYACTANVNMDGVMSADGKTCALDDGSTATFTPALDPMQSVIDIEALTIVVSNADGQCAKFVESDSSGLSLTTASGTVDVGGDASTYSVDCPNGTTYKSDSPFDLLSCGDGNLFDSKLPGTFKSGSFGFFSFGISPKPADVETGFVDCKFPETP